MGNFVYINQKMYLKIDNGNIQEPSKNHSTNLTTKEFDHFWNKQKIILANNMYYDEKERKENILSSLIQENYVNE